MAAYFTIVDKETYGKVWHVGSKPNISTEEIKLLKSVQIDGHEAALLYGFGLVLDGKRVHTLRGNDAKFYALLMIETYKDAKRYEDIEGKINTGLRGEDNPQSN